MLRLGPLSSPAGRAADGAARGSCIVRRAMSASIIVTRAASADRDARFNARPGLQDLKFGQTMSDHMITCEHKNGEWQTPELKPFANLEISPAASSLHYGLSCFEGMKAYKDTNTGQTRLFRPDMNVKRLESSMGRLQMPTSPLPNVLDLIKELVKIDDRWIPALDGYSLYLRPTVIATHPYLGLAPPTELLLYIISCPVGPYFSAGTFQPISLLASPDYVRAWPGGTGQYKVSGNYAPTMKPQAAATAQGLSQVLWLYNGEEATEAGGMNIFFVVRDEHGRDVLVTPPLHRGDILPGVTRDSILYLARNHYAATGLKVEERFPTMTELRALASQGRLKEAFGTGTAAVVTPIEGIFYQDSMIDIPATGPWTREFWKHLTDIQYGRAEGPKGWSVIV